MTRVDLGPLNIPECIIESAAVPIAGAYSRSRKSVLESPDLPSTYFQVRENVVRVLGIEKRPLIQKDERAVLQGSTGK